MSAEGALDALFLRAVSYGESRNRQIVPGAQGPGDAGVENRRVALVIDYVSTVPASEEMTLQ